ncbi:tumor protein p53-inducible nuclear protein 2 isoform X1 [Polypterus senegalus]|uniref:tumor protein p53-inducible nuclear protein 2 isoform X1 n=1 Tax=Polypterus senegalus TaxID=55291 RepID=UPI00196386B6|nr:tumor protein p53-inducible nuclear protein 2 isoform X1 [Polypterus senegalus]
MFQRLSSLFFGSLDQTPEGSAEPKPSVSDADEDGWLLVNLPDIHRACSGEGNWVEQEHERDRPQRLSPSSSDHSGKIMEGYATHPPPSTAGRCRTRPSSCSPDWTGFITLESPTSCPLGSSPPTPGSQSDCSGRFKPRWMDESWYVTPPPCFTAEGATPESSPLEDLLIEHPSMSVYMESGIQSINEEIETLPLHEVNLRVEPLPSGGQTITSRASRVSDMNIMSKVNQVSRVQRAKARVERRQLSRNLMQRQNCLRENLPQRRSRGKGSFVHQPCRRQFNY